MNTYRHDSCPLCRAKGADCKAVIAYHTPVLFSNHEVVIEVPPELWVCRHCGSWFVQNIFPEELAKRYYAEGASGERWSNVAVEVSKTPDVIKELGTLFQKETRILDIGCNTGALLDFAKDRGCQTSGVEFSCDSRLVLSQKGHTTYSSLNEVTGRFDIITAFDLVEHLYRIADFFDVCRSLLTPSGRFVILTGNINSMSARLTQSKWWYLRYPEHIVFPSKKVIDTYPGFKMSRWMPTYASAGYKHSLIDMCQGVMISFLMGNYEGLPSLGPDHVLAVLDKC